MATVLGIQHEIAQAIAAGLPKINFSGVLKPRMTAAEQLLASLLKITPRVTSQQEIAGLDRALANSTGESDDAEASDTTETDENESGD